MATSTPPVLGRTLWAIPEGYIPPESNGPAPTMTSHEAVCLLNTTEQEAHVEITIFFADRDPVGPYKLTVPPRRTLHQRFNNLDDPEPIPKGTDYSSVIVSDVPIIAQHTPRFAPSGKRFAHHDCLRRRRLELERLRGFSLTLTLSRREKELRFRSYNSPELA